MKLLPAAARKATPWKNGGGRTWTVAAQPEDAGPDRFDWRISMAEVADAGPFSLFPGMDRIITILSGQMRLVIDGQAHLLDAASRPLPFAGDVPTEGTPLGGPVLDLNLMVRRGVQASVSRLGGVLPKAETRILFATSAGTLIQGEQVCPVARHDAVWITGRVRWEGDPPLLLAIGMMDD